MVSLYTYFVAFSPCLVFGGWFLLRLLRVFTEESLTRYAGRMTPGVPIWTEPLPKEMDSFFRHLAGDVVGGNQFIKVTPHAILVGGTNRRFTRTTWPYAAHIPLTERTLRVTYRTRLSGLLILGLLLFGFFPLGTFFMFPFVSFMLFFNHLSQRELIMRFIREQMQKSYEGTLFYDELPPVRDEQDRFLVITSVGKQMLFTCFVGGVVSLFTFMMIHWHFGGTAINGYIENGHYYLSTRWRDTEVSLMMWVISYIHTVLTYLTVPLIAVVILLLFVKGEIAIKIK